MRVGQILIGLAHIATIVGFIVAVPDHVGDPTWPHHAQNHVLQALFWIVGFNVICLVLLALPFRKQEKWAWWALLAAGIFIFGGYFVAIPITSGGAPGAFDDLFFGVLWAVQGVGLAMSWKAFDSQSPQNLDRPPASP